MGNPEKGGGAARPTLAALACVGVVVGAVAVAAGVGGRAAGVPRHTLVVGAVSRDWYQFTPAGVSRPAAVVIALHGLGGGPADLMAATGLDGEAERDGFVVVYPVGVDKAWNAASCCGSAPAGNVDDIGFLTALVGRLTSDGTADSGRVFFAGFSNGAMMTFDLACRRPDLMRGAAVVDGTLSSPCPAHGPVDLLLIHQRGDTVVPFAGTATPAPWLGDSAPFPPVPTAVATWLAADRCQTGSVASLGTRTYPVEEDVFACPAGTRTVVDVIEGGGHRWPHGSGVPLDATSALARFFGLRR